MNIATLQTAQWLIAAGLNSIIAMLGWWSPQKALTKAGVLHAAVLGLLVWGGLGWAGYLVVAAYFLLGTAVTRIGRTIKEAKGIAEKRGGSRGPENVWGSAFTGAVCAVGYALWPHPLWWLAYCASFTAKLADTVSSEVGKAYGQHTFLITTWQPVPAGTEGAVSQEGTLAGVIAALTLSGLGSLLGFVPGTPGFGSTGLGWWLGCAAAGIIATLLESVLGVWQEQIPGLTNERVNAIQTTVAALLAVLLIYGGQQVGLLTDGLGA